MPMKPMLNVMKKLQKGMLYSRGLRLGKLDGYERLIAGIYGQPDRVPLICQPYTYAMGLHSLPSRKFFSESLPFVHASANMARYLDIDSWNPIFDFYNIELEALGQPLIWREGSEPDVDSQHPLIASEYDFRRLRPPVPGRDGRMAFVLESYKRYMDITGLQPMVYACAPFTMAVLIRGYVNFLRDMRRNPKFAHQLMEFLSMEVVVPWIARMVRETGSSIVVMSDAWASPPNATLEMVEEFCLPYVHKIIKATNSPIRTVFDSGVWGERAADPRAVLDMKMQMMVPGNDFKALRPFFLLVWSEDYDAVGIPFLRRYADGKKVCLLLNIFPPDIEAGPPERIAELIKRLVREGAGSGRFALLANLIPIGTPVEHAHAVVEAVKQFGTYPVDPAALADQPFHMPAVEPFDDWYRRDGLRI